MQKDGNEVTILSFEAESCGKTRGYWQTGKYFFPALPPSQWKQILYLTLACEKKMERESRFRVLKILSCILLGDLRNVFKCA